MNQISNDFQKRKRANQHHTEIFRNRIIVSFILMLIAFLLLWSQLFRLQVLEHTKYRTISDQNRIKLMPLAPTRGQIFDRNGKILATNIPSFDLEIIKQDIPEGVKIDDLLARIDEVLPLTEEEIEQFHQNFQRAPLQEPITLKAKVTEEEIAIIALNQHLLTGLHITPKLTRFYPYGEHGVHALGYVARIDDRDLKEIKEHHLEKEYASLSHIGKRGAEKSFEYLLRGKTGFEQVETSSNGRVVRKISETPPIPGSNIYLTLDIEMQKIAEEALEGYNGAIVAIDPNNGEVIAFASTPTYDPNLFVNGISKKDFDLRNNDPNTPFFNRVMQGRYPPGSAIKPQVALAGLHHGTITPNSTIMCNGSYQIEGDRHRFRDLSRHGATNVTTAIERSCNVFFYDLSYNLGITPLMDFLKRFSLGTPTGIDLIGEASGVAPTPDYKRHRFDAPWYAGDTVTAGIGQSFWLTTPLQITQATAIIAVSGKAYTPHILQSFSRPNSPIRYPIPLNPIKPIVLSNEEHWGVVQNAMTRVIHSPRGTGRRINTRELEYRMAGKTGTAQVRTVAQGKRYNRDELDRRHLDHAWFTAYAPAEDPQLVVTVLVENGESSGRVAAPMAKKVFDAWLKRDQYLMSGELTREEEPHLPHSH